MRFIQCRRAIARVLLAACAPLGLLTFAGQAAAQQSTGSTGTTCTQNGSEVTCVTTAKFTLPSGVNLQAGAVGTNNFVFAASGGPGCSGLTAAPTTVPANTATQIALTVSGCASGVSYSWASPATASTTNTSNHTLTLASGAAAQQYSVQVCLPGQTAAPGCQTYSTSVSVAGSTPQLAGCVINPNGASITTSGSTSLSVACTAGTGAGSGVTYQWRLNGNDIANATGSSLNVSGAQGVGSYSYTVAVANNAPSNVVTPAVTVNVTAPVTNTCPAGVQVPSVTFSPSDPPQQGFISANHPGSTPYVIAINVPSGLAGRVASNLSFSPYSGPGAREVSVSRSPCDFSNIVSGVGGPTSIYFGYDTNASPPIPGVNLAPGIWYVNMRSPTAGRCGPSQTCSMNIQWAP